jgi:hypothetical protein
MTYRGAVKGGVVVLDAGLALPEGTVVSVEPLGSTAPEGDAEDELSRLGDLAVETGVSDLAVNADHYLYGHPKRAGGAE